MSTSAVKIAATSIYDGITKRGILDTLLMIYVVFADWIQSKKRNFFSYRYLDPKDSRNQTANSIHGNYFQPVRVGPFLQLMKEMKFDRSHAFVDIGAGTGKAMYLAAESGWTNISGCEICPELAEVAQKNIELAKKRFPTANFAIDVADAMDFQFKSGSQIIYMNDPFYEPLFSRFLDRLKERFTGTNSEITVIYKNNSKREIQGFNDKSFHSLGEKNLMGNLFEIYKLRNS